MARVTPHTRSRRIEGEAATIVDPAVTAPARLAPSTSLIISSRDRPVFLEQVVASVLAGDECPDEVVVIDQSREPNDHLMALAAESPGWLRYQWTTERGLSRGRNAGIRLARGDWLVFIDDDVVVCPEWFGRIFVRAPGGSPSRDHGPGRRGGAGGTRSFRPVAAPRSSPDGAPRPGRPRCPAPDEHGALPLCSAEVGGSTSD